MAALSVHSFSGGARKVRPPCPATRSSMARSALLAATPPATTRCRPSGHSLVNWAMARRVRSPMESATAAWNAAHTSATSWSDRGCGNDSTSRRTAFLRPEKLKSQPGLPFMGRGRAKRAGSPRSAALCTCGPPG